MEYKSNKIQLWDAYQEFMSGCLIALDKQPGIRPVGIGEKCRQSFAKYVLKFIGTLATPACKDEQL